MDLFPRVERATVGAEQDTETGFFQDLHVVVVGVAHGPSRGVLFSLLAFRRVDKPVEQFTIAFDNSTDDLKMTMAWDDVKIEIPLNR